MGQIVSKIRHARLKYQVKLGRDVSVQEVASAIGISRTALSNIERGLSWPSKTVLEGLCAFYRVPLDELVEYVEELQALRPALAWTTARDGGLYPTLGGTLRHRPKLPDYIPSLGINPCLHWHRYTNVD